MEIKQGISLRGGGRRETNGEDDDRRLCWRLIEEREWRIPKEGTSKQGNGNEWGY